MQSVFKPQGSTITVKEFRQVMGNLGEQLSADELNELFKELKMEKEESFNYEEFIKTILTRWLEITCTINIFFQFKIPYFKTWIF